MRSRPRRAPRTGLARARIPRRLLIMASMAALTVGHLAARPAFPDPALPVPSASHLAIADFNGDGIPDAAVSTYAPGGVVVALGQGDGTLATATSIPLEPGVLFVAAADLNRDSRQDLVLANVANDPFQPGDGATWVILGRGDGSFLPATRLTTGVRPKAVAMGDFDEDGNPDLASISTCSAGVDCPSGEVWISPGYGDGTFGPATGTPAGREPVYLVSGDFNEDGHVDLMVANTRAFYPEGPGDLSFLAGRGDGTFAPEQDVTEAVVAPHALAVGDFNADGHLDIAGIRHTGHSVSIYIGRGDGTFAWNFFPTGQDPTDVVVGDFNADGLQDVATSNNQSDNLAVLPGRGDGSFGEALRTDAANGPSGLGFADFDGDDRMDAVVANEVSETVLLLPGHGDGTFGTPTRPLDRFGSADSALADFDRDGHQDLLVSYGSQLGPPMGRMSFLRGLGDGSFGPEIPFAAETLRGPLRVADFDEDGIPDFAVGNLDTSEISIFLGLGDGSFGQERRVSVGPSPGHIAAGDLNGDGHVDLAVVNQGANYPVRLPADISLLLGRGDGTFALEVRFSGVSDVINTAIADFNGDGMGDLAATSESDLWDSVPGELNVFLSLGGGAFDAGRVMTAGKAVFGVVATDVNSDGRTDLVVNNRGVIQREWESGDLALFLGRGDGSFEAGSRIETGGSPIYLEQADVDLDGRIDLVSSNSAEDASVLFGGGDGTFAPPERFGTQNYPYAFAAGDLNGDGRPDLVALGDSQIVVLLNRIEPLNTPPHASINSPASAECGGPAGAAVVLDGSASVDPDGPYGGSDYIVKYEWFLVLGPRARAPLGTGAVLTVTLPLGSHLIELRVTDTHAAAGEAQAVVAVRDTIPPSLSVAPDPTVLWPPNHRLVPVSVALLVSDRCDPAAAVRLVAVTSSEPDDAPEDRDGRTQGDITFPDAGASATEILLRAERDGDGPGRTYELTYTATDASGNSTVAPALVSVPHDLGQGPEPLSIRASPAGMDGSARWSWNGVMEAKGYDLISGDLASLRMEPGRVSLGAVRVLARRIQETSWSEDGAPLTPVAGGAFFYLVEYRDARGPTGFGIESVPLPREPSSCDAACPGMEAEYLASTKAETRRR